MSAEMFSLESPRRSPLRLFMQRLFRNWPVRITAVILLIFIAVAIFAPQIMPNDPYQTNLRARFAPFSSEHWLGTDQLGRDMLSRIILGTRLALYVGVVSLAIGLLCGGVLGLLAGFVGGALDAFIMRVMDVILSFPWLLLVIAVVSILGPNITNAMLAIGLTLIPEFARLVRSVALSVRETDYVQAAYAVGASRLRIMAVHVLPHSVAQIIVLSTVTLGKAILAEAGLSFLGLGVQPPEPSWGTMIAVGQSYLRDYPHLSLVPGVAVMLVVVALNIVGDGLRDALDPRAQHM